MDTQVWMYAHLRIYAAISPTKPIDSISINADLTSCVMYMGHDILFSVIPGVPFYQHGLTLIPAWISNAIHYDEWDEITYQFKNVNGAAVEVWDWIRYLIAKLTWHLITYPCKG